MTESAREWYVIHEGKTPLRVEHNPPCEELKEACGSPADGCNPIHPTGRGDRVKGRLHDGDSDQVDVEPDATLRVKEPRPGRPHPTGEEQSADRRSTKRGKRDDLRQSPLSQQLKLQMPD